MKRLLLGLLVASVLGGLAYAYVTVTREWEYRRLIESGHAALRAGQTFEAVGAFSDAIRLKSDSMLAYLRRGETYRAQGELPAAERDLRRAWQLDPSATRPLEALGDVRFESGAYQRAADRYADYVALDDRSPRVLYKLALARYRAGSPAAGVDPLTRAVALDEEFAEAHYLLGLCLRDSARPEDARASLERAVELDAAFVMAREALAGLHREAGRTAEHLDQLEALVTVDPRPVRRIALALAQARIGRQAQAVETLRLAAERSPDDGSIYVALGRIWLDASQGGRDRIALSKALEALQEAAARNDDTNEVGTLLGRALLLASEVESAERVLQQAVSRLPVDPSTFLLLAEAAERLGHLSEARAALLRHQALVGEDPVPARQARRAARLGDLSARLGDPTAAAAWFGRAADLTPTPGTLLQLARQQVAAGDTEGARATVERGLEIEPDDAALLAFLRRLR